MRELRDTNGDRSPVGTKLTVNSAALVIIKTTDIPLLGGTYGFSAVVPHLHMNNRLTVPTPGGAADAQRLQFRPWRRGHRAADREVDTRAGPVREWPGGM